MSAHLLFYYLSFYGGMLVGSANGLSFKSLKPPSMRNGKQVRASLGNTHINTLFINVHCSFRSSVV